LSLCLPPLAGRETVLDSWCFIPRLAGDPFLSQLMSHSHSLFLSHILLMTCSKPEDSVLLENDSLPTLKEASYTEEELIGPTEQSFSCGS